MMNKYKAICLDLDGTVYRGVSRFQKQSLSLGMLQNRGIEPYFITNNSSMTRLQLQDKLSIIRNKGRL